MAMLNPPMARPKWMTEKRRWWLYEIRKKQEDSPPSVYVGVTSRPMRKRLRDHITAAQRGGMCPLHRALRLNDGSSWRIHAVEYLGRTTFAAARKQENIHKKRVEGDLLNRSTLRC